MGFLTGKTAIITGAGRAVLKDGSCGSIGYGIATAYAKEGANLVITGRNVKKLEAAKQELESLYGIKVLTVQADVCAGGDNEATVANVVKQAVDTFGGIQVLINNAQASASGVPLADAVQHGRLKMKLAVVYGENKGGLPPQKKEQNYVTRHSDRCGIPGRRGIDDDQEDPYSAGASFDGCRHLHHRRCADVRQKRGRRRDRLADHRV